MRADTLLSLYVDELRDLHFAENLLTKALPKMAKGATSQELAEAFNEHLAQTETHVARLEEIFKSLGEKPTGEKCEAMEGLVSEGSEILKAKGNDAVRDAGIIVAAQKVEHYEIAGYGSLCTFAKLLGRDEDLRLLLQTLEEEKAADKKLTELAMDIVNEDALEESSRAESTSSRR